MSTSEAQQQQLMLFMLVLVCNTRASLTWGRECIPLVGLSGWFRTSAGDWR